jgi:hypothetical protein
MGTRQALARLWLRNLCSETETNPLMEATAEPLLYAVFRHVEKL